MPAVVATPALMLIEPEVPVLRVVLPAPEIAPVTLMAAPVSVSCRVCPEEADEAASVRVPAESVIVTLPVVELELRLAALVLMVPVFEPLLLIVSVEALRVVVPELVTAPLTAMVPPVLLSWSTCPEASEDAFRVTVLEEPWESAR